MSAWNVHPRLATNASALVGRTPAPVFDESTSLCTLEASYLFRGTREAAVAAFSFGKQNCPSGGQGMFSLGPSSIEMVDFTGDDPHWDIKARWVGLHSDFSGPVFSLSNTAYTFMLDYPSRSTEFPITTRKSDDSGNRIQVAPSGAAPNFPVNPKTGQPWKARVKDWLPVLNVTAVIKDTRAPHPLHPKVLAILQAIQSTTYDDTANDYSDIDDPVWVSWKGFSAPANVVGGTWPKKSKWFPTISAARRIPASSGGESVFAFTINAPLEQQVQVG